MKQVKDIFATPSTFSAMNALAHQYLTYRTEVPHPIISTTAHDHDSSIDFPHVITPDPKAIQYHLNGASHGIDPRGYLPKTQTIHY
ncbi:MULTISPECIES: hypothetical protein [Acinetobacter]|uniref:hypothetical protein n=1 Tax=Acinetobacter TaxID=469 RepID=UPI0018A26499|nr:MULTISPECIES: hypothetical protein [Acinetobacter]MBF7689148.1 hypothetical protein [Acinetobacter pollinis]MBF7691809.1 hypothetical protein [Acinetobacter pollinis]MBF7698344.1 hypothetical protein [Acinetobacter pollinis]MBF7699914.1 hypothetical protein [Acinetobacter pollinis]WEV49594.1 hypothetical protein OZX61_03775 [Acinetobacter sp. ESL0695]